MYIFVTITVHRVKSLFLFHTCYVVTQMLHCHTHNTLWYLQMTPFYYSDTCCCCCAKWFLYCVLENNLTSPRQLHFIGIAFSLIIAVSCLLTNQHLCYNWMQIGKCLLLGNRGICGILLIDHVVTKSQNHLLMKSNEWHDSVDLARMSTLMHIYLFSHLHRERLQYSGSPLYSQTVWCGLWIAQFPAQPPHMKNDFMPDHQKNTKVY